MNYDPCHFLDPSLYQQQSTISSTSPSLSSSSSSSPSSRSSSSSSAQELQLLHQQQRIEHSTTRIQPISTVATTTMDPFYSANRTNTYYPPVTDTNICTSSPTIIDYNNHTYYFVSTHRSIIQQCSDTFFLLTGYSPFELIGKSLADFLHPDDLYHHGHHVGATFPFIRFYKKNGQTLPLECKKVTNSIQDQAIYIGIVNSPSKPLSSTTPSSFGRPDMINVNSEFQIPTSCCMNSSSASSSNFYKNNRDILLHNYMCVDCGTTASPEWRRGPHGPKTLCNACGLRWAKKNKRK